MARLTLFTAGVACFLGLAASHDASRKLSFQSWHEEDSSAPESAPKHHSCVHDELAGSIGHDVHEESSAWVTYEAERTGRSLSGSYSPIRIHLNLDRITGTYVR